MARPALAFADHVDDGTPEISVGDIVRAGANLYPHFRVIAVSGERAWVRDVQSGTDHIVATNRFHRL